MYSRLPSADGIIVKTWLHILNSGGFFACPCVYAGSLPSPTTPGGEDVKEKADSMAQHLRHDAEETQAPPWPAWLVRLTQEPVNFFINHTQNSFLTVHQVKLILLMLSNVKNVTLLFACVCLLFQCTPTHWKRSWGQYLSTSFCNFSKSANRQCKRMWVS